MKKTILLVLFTLLLTSCFWWENKVEEIKEEVKISFENPVNKLEQEINARESDREDSNKDRLIDLVKSYLQYWDAYYKEKLFADKALKILNKMDSEFIVEYLKWYAYEIQTQYDKALIQYNKILSFKNITTKQKIEALNQKGHIFDLQWNLEKANKYYLEAEQLDSENIKTLVNRGRYEIRALNDNVAKTYFEKVLEKTKIKHLKSEMYYNLSIIAQNNSNLEEAIKNAKLWIREDKDYPNNYLSLWVLYISKWWDDIEKSLYYLNKSIELYPNNSIAYKNLGIYYYLKDNFEKSIENFGKQVEKSESDILLMYNDKKDSKISWEYDLARSYAMYWNKEKSVKYLKKVLNWKNEKYYLSFMMEYFSSEWPFDKIKKDIENEVKEIILKYNK